MTFEIIYNTDDGSIIIEIVAKSFQAASKKAIKDGDAMGATVVQISQVLTL